MSIISSLLANLARGSRRDRVCAKFVENEFEKCDHIMELYTRYDARVRAEEVCCSDIQPGKRHCWRKDLSLLSL